MRTIFVRRRTLLALCLALAACGKSSEPSGPSGPSEPAKTAEPSGTPATAGDPAAPEATSGPAPEADAPPAAEPEPDPAPPPPSGKDFIAQARLLFRVAACGGDEGAPLPEKFDAPFVERHCEAVEKLEERYDKRWLNEAGPFFEELVPDGLPETVVYPFAGADLLTALTVFPEMEELTTLSLEPAGDARAMERMPKRKVRRELKQVRYEIKHLMLVNHSKTMDMIDSMRRGDLPTHLILTLHALGLHGYEPVSLHYFGFADDGSIEYLTEEDVARADETVDGKVERNRAFANIELRYRKAGDESAPVRVYRHVRANLDDDHLGSDDPVLEHLREKGKVTAMTKAASYLLWYDDFDRFRSYLLDHIAWMVSDSTGIPPRHAKKAGFEQIPWGWFRKPLLNPGPSVRRELRRLYRAKKRRELPIRFGYPDGTGLKHLLVTRPKDGADEGDAGEGSAKQDGAKQEDDAG